MKFSKLTTLSNKSKTYFVSLFLICGLLLNSFSGFTHPKILTFFLNPNATITASSLAICKNETAIITFTGLEGTEPYTFTYQLNTDAPIEVTTTSGNSLDISLAGITVGDFTYKLTNVENSEGNNQTITDQEITVKVNPLPIVNFTFNNNASCSGEAVNFTNTSTGLGNLTYNWDFGDGKTSALQNPTNTFEALGCGSKFFNVKLTVTDENGCSASNIETISVAEKPDIQFRDKDTRDSVFSNCNNASPSNPNYEVTVENISNSTCIDSFSVDWGDGSSSSSVFFPATHTYNSIGVFDMKIRASGDNNCVNEVLYIVKNLGNPAAGFSSPGNTTNLCIAEAELNFGITNYQSNSNDTSYTLDFGDGSPLETYSQSEMTDPLINDDDLFSHKYEKGSCLEENGQFIATLSVQNACGTTQLTADNITILEPSVAKFESTEFACINDKIVFIDKSIVGNESNCVKNADVSWDFGDGTIIKIFSVTEASNIEHQYTNPGIYTVELSVLSKCNPSSFTKEICIEPEIKTDFSVDIIEGCIPLNVNATNTTDQSEICSAPIYIWTVDYSSDNCGSIADWDYTNGTDSTSENPQFIFNSPGKYTLNQKVTSVCGTKTVTKIIDVKKPPTASIQAIEDVCGTLTINPEATLENCSLNTAPLIYNWTFTGGSVASSNTLNPGNIEYTVPGIYEITLEVTNDCGISSIAKETFELFEIPNITNTNLTEEICDGQSTSEITLNSNNSETTYTWSATVTGNISGFITNGISNTIPAHIIRNTGNNPETVTYTTTPSLDACVGTPVNFIITVNPSPIINTQPVSSEICLDGTPTLLEVTYINGAGAATYQWFSNTTDATTSGSAITGETGSTYTAPGDTLGTVYYYVEISFSTGGCSQIISNTASVVVNPQITVNPIADPQTLCVGGLPDQLEVIFSDGTGIASYKWYSNTTNSKVDSNEIIGEINSTYTPNVLNTAGNFYYYAEISLDGNGCNTAVSDVFEITVLSDPIINKQPLVSQELCQGAPPYYLDIDASGGTDTLRTYQWYVNSVDSNTGGEIIPSETTLFYKPQTTTVGTFYYYIIVSQPESGCSVASDTSQLIVNAAPSINTQPVSSEICLDGTPTLLEVTYTNGAGAATYQWFSNTTDAATGGSAITGETGSIYTAPGDTLGTVYYYVEISFNTTGGCSQITSNTASVVVNEIPVINDDEITIYSKTSFNFDPSTIGVNIVPVGTKYTWSNPTFSPTGSIIGSSAETTPKDQISQTLENTGTTPIEVTYIITPVTTKCTGNEFTIVVTVNPSINSNALITNNTCFKSNDGLISTNINGGIPFETGNPYLISWIGPNGFTSTDTTIVNIEAGLYILEVEDKEGYSIREELTVTEPAILSISKDVNKNISCFGGNDGAIAVIVSGGTLPYTYNWSTTNGSGIIQNTQNQNALTPGSYTLEVTDKNNCISVSNYILTEPAVLKIDTIFKQDILCFSEGTGSIQVNISGGTPSEISPGNFDYFYNWTGPNGYTSSFKNINNLFSGNYTLTITDSLNCVESKTIVLNQFSEILIDYTKTDVTCYGKTDGTIEVTVSGGNPPYQISWNNLANGFSLSDLSANTYIATITDGNNCTQQQSIEITQPIFFSTPIITPISCNNENDGSIDLNLTDGIAPISVSWSDDLTAGSKRNNISPGSYTVTILDSDADQCPIIQTFIFTNPPLIAVSSQVDDALDCDIVNSGSIDITVSGGTAPYTFTWSNGEITEDLINISPGDYSVEIKDENNCIVTKQFSISRQEPLDIELIATTIPNCDLKTVSQMTVAKVTGGFLPYTYSWSAGSVSTTDNTKMVSSQNGAYTLTITDNKGCTKRKIFLVDLPSIGNADYSYTSFSIDNYNLLSIEDPIQFTNLTTGNYSNITWDFGDGSPTSSEENPIHSYNQVGVFNVVLKIELDFGCIEVIEKTLNITKGYVLITPNAFSPNNDGYNETIRPSFRGFEEIEMTIYDTWGVLIYYEKNLNLNGWDGKIKGLPAENGNYVMLVKGRTFYKKEINIVTAITLLI